jgi:hypothetical protein
MQSKIYNCGGDCTFALPPVIMNRCFSHKSPLPGSFQRYWIAGHFDDSAEI